MHSLEIYYSRTVFENKYEQTSVFLFVLSFVKKLFIFFLQPSYLFVTCNPHMCNALLYVYSYMPLHTAYFIVIHVI